MASLKQDAEQAGVRVVVVDARHAPHGLLDALVQAAQQASVIFLTELDSELTLYGVPVRRAPAVEALNLTRDRLPKVPARVVLWMSNAAFEAFRNLAADLNDVVLTRAIFEVEEKKGAIQDWKRGPHFVQALSEEESTRLRREASILQPIAEHQHGIKSGEAAARLGQLFWNLGELQTAVHWLTRAEQVFEAEADFRETGRVLMLTGKIHFQEGRIEEAKRTYQRALKVFQKAERPIGPAIAWGGLADVFQYLEQNLEKALWVRQTKELPAYEKYGDLRNQGIALNKIADILRENGQIDEALRLRRHEVLPIYDVVDDPREKAITMSRIASDLYAKGHGDEALRILSLEVLPGCEAIGEREGRATALKGIARILEDRGELEEAERLRTTASAKAP